jgi:hypothetical protein
MTVNYDRKVRSILWCHLLMMLESYFMTLANVIYSFMVTVIMIINYDRTIFMIVNYNPKTFIAQATGLLKPLFWTTRGNYSHS